MTKKRKDYSQEYKIEAAKLIVEQGKSQASVCRHLGVSSSTICKWVKDYSDSMSPKSVVETEKDKEINRLKKELNQLKIEQEILKKATAYFARSLV